MIYIESSHLFLRLVAFSMSKKNATTALTTINSVIASIFYLLITRVALKVSKKTKYNFSLTNHCFGLYTSGNLDVSNFENTN